MATTSSTTQAQSLGFWEIHKQKILFGLGLCLLICCVVMIFYPAGGLLSYFSAPPTASEPDPNDDLPDPDCQYSEPIITECKNIKGELVECGGGIQFESQQITRTADLERGGKACDYSKTQPKMRECNTVSCDGSLAGAQANTGANVQTNQVGLQTTPDPSDPNAQVQALITQAEVDPSSFSSIPKLSDSNKLRFVGKVGSLCTRNVECKDPLKCLPAERDVCFLTKMSEGNNAECPEGFYTSDHGGFHKLSSTGEWFYPKICCTKDSNLKIEDLAKVNAICPASNTGNKFYTSSDHDIATTDSAIMASQATKDAGYNFQEADFTEARKQLKFTACQPYNPEFKAIIPKYCVLSSDTKCPDHYLRMGGLPMKSLDVSQYKNRPYPDLGEHSSSEADKKYRQTAPTLCCLRPEADDKRFINSRPDLDPANPPLTGKYICRQPYRNKGSECSTDHECRATSLCGLGLNKYFTHLNRGEPTKMINHSPDASNYDLQTNKSLKECSEACLSDPRCKVFSIGTAGPTFGKCYLLKENLNQSEDPKMVNSGGDNYDIYQKKV